MNIIKILWMYPDILSLHGERGSLMAFIKQAEHMGVKPEIRKVSHPGDEIPLEWADVVAFLPGQVYNMSYIANELSKNKKSFEQYAERGKWILAIGTSGCLLGKQTKLTSGECFEGLSLLPINCAERVNQEAAWWSGNFGTINLKGETYGDDLHFKIDVWDIEAIGYQIQRLDFFLEDACHALGRVCFGYGNNSKDGTEGARYKNVMFTNCLGPFLAKNPAVSAQIISASTGVKGEIWQKELMSKIASTHIEFMQNKKSVLPPVDTE